jgi:DNA polymerase-1
LEADYKQLEVRIAAWLSGDPVMREIFEGGRDPHQEIAWSIYHKPKEEITHYMRWLAKNVLFGLLYGRGYESVATGPEQEDIAARGGRRWSIGEVKSFFDSLLAEWKVYAAWQREQKLLGYQDGEITMPTGRVRRFPFIPKHDAGYVGRASFNNPTQGTASDFTLNAMITLHERLPEGAHLVMTVHDSLLIECREELADEVCELVRTVMEEEPLFELLVDGKHVPLLVDLDVTKVWGGDEFAKSERLVAKAA